MYENTDAPELSALLEKAIAGESVGATIDELSGRLLRAVLAKHHPEAAWLTLDWGGDGLSIGALYNARGFELVDFDVDDEAYPEDLWALASNIRSVADLRDIVEGPNNGPFRLNIR
ncbi:hypothetical protein ACT17_05915 [Mycolicibacterium conceptionense]|uniref:Uncharacterized protein n=1 Tax=Mycolicibacterium conceptionense TaxID=451644 RepID=A0A0J8UE47_9MYCO|nr:hypothetical protein [Mycolicibacterium conceptionense]KMV19586.1 hypothetical protein ACT17_05915 [Mycolicibacterium conceptionense]